MNPWSTAEAIGAQAKEGQTVQAGRPRGARPRRQCRVQLWLVRGDEITMRVTRHHRPIVSLLALALVLGAGFLPAAAQSGSEAVVCVGSETRTLQTNPIRRVYTEDMEVVYRIGVDIGQRFSSQNDGSGYEVLLRETWSVAEGAVAAAGGRELSPPDGPICTENYSPDSCWMELVDRLGCYLWNPNPRENVTVTWSGGCSNGLAQGNGEVNWYQNDELIQIWETRLQDGHPDGPFVQRYGDGALEADGQHMNGEMHGTWTWFLEDVGREVGPYVNDERHGTWTGYDQSGNELGTIRFENGRRVGGLDDAVALIQFGATPHVAA